MNREFAFIETNTADDWKLWSGRNFEVSDGATDKRRNGRLAYVHIAKETVPMFVSPRLVIERLRTGVGVIDIALDRCGIHYLLGTDANIYRFDPTWADSRSLPCVWRSHKGVGTPQALCVSGDTIYVAFSSGEDDDSENEIPRAGIHLVSKHRRPIHEIADSQPEISFEKPTQVVTTNSEDDVFILDEAEGSVTSLTSDGTTRIIVSGLRSPKDIAIDGDGNLYVLDGKDLGEPEVAKQGAINVGERMELVLERYDPPETTESNSVEWSKTVLTDDFPFKGRACIEVINTNDVVIGVHPDSDVLGEKTLLRYRSDEDVLERIDSFKKSCTQLQRRHASSDSTPRGLYAIDGDEQTVYFLGGLYKNKVSESGGTSTETNYTAQIQTRFDSGIPGMEWHRLRLDLDTAVPGTRIRVTYIATDDERVRPEDWPEAKRLNQRDVLLDQANGRYLWLSLELTGSEYTSPRVKSVRVYFPRRSYLQYLPAIYASDTNTGDFLHRFLTIFETTFAEFDDELAGFTRYLDPHGVPEDALSWLGRWLAVAAEESWSVEGRRTLIEKAPALFKKRGTRAGLQELLEIYFGQYELSATEREQRYFFSILEYADLHCQTLPEYDHETLTAFTNLLPSPREFLVLIGPAVDEDTRRTVEQIVNSEKPAHAAGRTVSLQPAILLGDHTYLGINSHLPSQDFIVGESNLGTTSVLGECRHSDVPTGRDSKIET